MSLDLIILASLTSIWALLMIMRTNVSLAIMGLCAGYVFSDLLSDEVVSLVLKNTTTADAIPVVSGVSVALILAPALLILLRFKSRQKGRFIQHVVPAIGFALLATLLTFSNLPIEVERYLDDESVVFQQFMSFEVLIAAAVVGIAIVDVVIHDGEHRRKYRKKHKKE